MNNLSSQDHERDSKRLKMMTINPQASWTGLKPKEVSLPAGNKLTMEGLLLWSVLGFALQDEKDYATFSVVNKEWNHMVQILFPPVMMRIMAVLGRNGVQVVEQDDLPLLETAFQCMESSASPLYRKDSEGDCHGWPHLQPHYALILIRFVYEACTQKSPKNWSKDVYDIVCGYLNTISQKKGKAMIELLDQNGAAPQDTVKGLLGYWTEWNGIVHTVKSVSGYLERFYVKQNSATTFVQHAESSLLNQILQGPNLCSKIEQLIQNVCSNIDSIPRPLLMQAFQAGEAWKTPLPGSGSVPTGQLDPVLERVKEPLLRFKTLMEERVLPQEQVASAVGVGQQSTTSDNTTITVFLPDGTKHDVSAHFVEASGLLSNLHLRDGDRLKLQWGSKSSSQAFRVALEIYGMDERTPMPRITTPLRSSELEELVGEQYAQRIATLETNELFELISLANFFHLKKLLDLGVLQISFLIKGKSSEEMRALFQVS